MVHNMDDRWMYVEGKREGRPYAAALRIPFGPARWPEYDHHVVLALEYLGNWRNGLPKPKELIRLQDFEDGIIEKLEGHGALVATETGSGTRTIHLFIRGGGLVELYRDYERRDEVRGMKVRVAHDPQWEGVAHLAALAERAAA
jgi:Family of unknown function (DUF695)